MTDTDLGDDGSEMVPALRKLRGGTNQDKSLRVHLPVFCFNLGVIKQIRQHSQFVGGLTFSN